MKSVNEMMGVGSVTGIGAEPSPGLAATMTPDQKARFKEPGRKKKKDPRVVKDPLVRKALSFKEWLEEESKHDVRSASGKMVHIKKAPVRHPGGKVTMEYPGKSSSSGGGD